MVYKLGNLNLIESRRNDAISSIMYESDWMVDDENVLSCFLDPSLFSPLASLPDIPPLSISLCLSHFAWLQWGFSQSQLSVKSNLNQWSEIVSSQQHFKLCVCARRAFIINCRSHWTETLMSLLSVHLSNERTDREGMKYERNDERVQLLIGVLRTHHSTFWLSPPLT